MAAASTGLQLLANGQVALDELVTASLPTSHLFEAFELAADKTRPVKVQFRFSEER